MKKKALFIFLGIACLVVSCKNHKAGENIPQEDRSAKQTLQGIWVDDYGQDVAFKVKGDTIFYPDSTSQPVYFQVFRDTLVLHGANDVKYAIVKLTPHLFIFRNQNGDQIRLSLSENPDDAWLFSEKRPQPLNQNQLIKRDTIISNGSDKYHCYVQVNPTTYKVIKTSYNDDGVEVDNVYHDNIVNLNIYQGARKLFSGDFRKQQFASLVPEDFLSQSILSDLVFKSIDQDGIHYIASLMIPDSMSSFQVELTVSYAGKLKMRVR